MSRFALHRAGQDCQVCPRWHARACRGLALVGPKRAGLGYRRAGLNEQPATDRRKGLPPGPQRPGLHPSHSWRLRRHRKDENARSMTTSPSIRRAILDAGEIR